MEMASLQKKKVHGKEYWYIVEGRRIKGKPRPFVLEYLGNAKTLLRRLQKEEGQKKLKSLSHGAACILLEIACKRTLRRNLPSPRPREERKTGYKDK